MCPICAQYVPKMCLLMKITYGEFSEFVREKKITYISTKIPETFVTKYLKHYPTTIGFERN